VVVLLKAPRLLWAQAAPAFPVTGLVQDQRTVMKAVAVAVVSLVALAVSRPGVASAEPVAVRQVEGLVHGFLVLRSSEGAVLASGDLIQVARGNRVTSRLVFHFKDGSLHDETAVFSQAGHFQLLSDHLVQRGAAFERPLDMTIDRRRGRVTVRYTDDGKEKVEVEQMELPLDLANGMIITLLKNVRPDVLPPSVSFIAATPKPRVVKLVISAAGAEPFTLAGSARRAMHYVVKVDIGGLSGLIAPLLGKQPPDSHVWILGGEAPAFVKSEAALFLGGPLWRTELISPVWPRSRR